MESKSDGFSLAVAGVLVVDFFFFFLRFYFSFFSPKPPIHSCIFLVVGPSSCGMWDATSAWLDEQCHVLAQDPNRQNPRLPKQST